MSDHYARVAELCGARSVRRVTRLQPLWAGYGELSRVELEGGPRATAILKWSRPPPEPPRGDASDTRKRRSYQVEATFYRDFAPRSSSSVRVAQLIGHEQDGDARLLVLEDLDAAGYDARRRQLSLAELDACLRWLAGFHATFLGQEPAGLWPIGSYWQLETRLDELGAVADPAVREAAPELHRRLESCSFRTLVHGDAKEANFCFRSDGSRVAALDFQYVGGGSGMRDLAYLLHGRHDEPADGIAVRQLDIYFLHLCEELGARGLDGRAVERDWRPLYGIAKADFLRFLAGWAPEHASRDVRGQRFLRGTIAAL